MLVDNHSMLVQKGLPRQDAANKNGGKWIVRLRKGLASRCWENMILAMLGEQFMVGDEICGAVISVRFQVRETGVMCSLLVTCLYFCVLYISKDRFSVHS